MRKSFLIFFLLLTPYLCAQNFNGSLSIPVPNDGATGTLVNKLAIVNAAGQAILATTANTGVLAYIVTANAGTTGNAGLAVSGVATCTMDASSANTVGQYYVIVSVTDNGKCHAQTATPSGGTGIVGYLIVTPLYSFIEVAPSLAGTGIPYPGAGVPNSTGMGWGTSYTVGNSANNIPQLNASAQLIEDTLGNAATATAAKNSPTQCTGGNLATGIGTNFGANCTAPPSGTLGGQTKGFATIGLTGAAGSGTTVTNSPAFVDASLFTGAPDICLQIKNAQAALVGAQASGFNIVMPLPAKAYCGTKPQGTNGHGEVYLVGNATGSIIYQSITLQGISSGIHFHGTGPTGVTNSAASNITWKACNPRLHGNTYPGDPSGAPCAAFFDSTTNMPQKSIASVTAASGGHATITLNSGGLSGTLPPLYTGRLLCVGFDNTTAGDPGCYLIISEPTGCNAACVFTVNSTTMATCTTCGTAFLDTPQLNLNVNAGTGATGFFVQFDNFTWDCAYVFACDDIVNAADQEGTMLKRNQLFNATAFFARKYIGNNATPNSYGGNNGGASHSGPDEGLWINYQSEDCELAAGCWGTNSNVNAGALTQFAEGSLMVCGDNTKMPATSDAVIAYSSTIAHSTCQKNTAGLVSDGIAMGTNSQSHYGFNGVTVSLKDVFNTGSHVTMPELTNSIGIYVNGAVTKFDGVHIEYASTCAEVGGNATQNETWVADGITNSEGASFENGDFNNCNNPAAGSPTGWVFDLGTANGTVNALDFKGEHIQTVTGSHFLQNGVLANANCTTSTDTTLYYVMEQNTTQNLLLTNCTGVTNIFPQGLNTLSASVADPSFGSSSPRSPSACETSYGITTLNIGATTTDTGLNCLPANAIIDSVVYRITTTITTAANFTIGDATTAARFCSTQSTLTAGTTGTCFVQADQTGAAGPRQTSAAKVRVTSNVNPGAGAIRLIVYYHSFTPPTS